MSSSLSPNLDMNYPDPIEATALSIALIGPDTERRKLVVDALTRWPEAEVREFPAYPPSLDDVPGLLELAFNVILIDGDSDPEYTIQIVGAICCRHAATVMVYSTNGNQDVADRCRHAGAREFFDPAHDESRLADALARAAALSQPRAEQQRQSGGKQLVFFGAKGGAGTTTIACNYAVALVRESRQRTLLIDLGQPLGDAALNLGIAAEHSTEDAFHHADQFDPSLLEALVTTHTSGLTVLAAPSKVPEAAPGDAALDKILTVARAIFDYVIVDVGSRVDLMNTVLFTNATTIYMVTQAGISELRNADRLITRYFNQDSRKLEIVVNRFDRGASKVSEDQMTKALGKPVRWRVPEDDDASRYIQDPETAKLHAGSDFSLLMTEMANSVNEYAARHNVISFRSPNGTASASDVASEMGVAAADGNSTAADSDLTKSNGAASNAGGLPSVTWHTPEAITYGTGLSDAQLNATAAVPGNFIYTPGTGYVLPVGTHTLWVTFTPDGGPMVQSAVSISVNKATPAIMWPVPRPIACDTPLSEDQLNATASVPGTFEYSSALGDVLEAGEHALSVIFYPNDNKNYSAAKATVALSIEKLIPAVQWAAPDKKIPYGGALSARHLNATASVAGTFDYNPSAGEVMEPGEHTLSVTFTPADSARYATVTATVTATVMKAPPRVSWATPGPIVYGAPLGPGQLNATASVEGTFEYNPPVGAILAVGEHTPSVTFTPKDNSDYSTIQAAVSLSVVMAKPVITWATPEAIPSGTPLGATELNATASVPGTFVYKPGIGEMLPAGTHSLVVTFTPVDAMNYEPAKATVSLTVTELSPAEINWPTPARIPYGVAISETQLNATSSVPGRFAYGPTAGSVLPPGKHTLSAIFTPANSRKFAMAQATVTLEVQPLPDVASLLTAAPQAMLGRNVTIDDTAAVEFEREVRFGRRISEERQVPPKESTPAKPVVSPSHRAPSPQKPRETRIYKGVIYEKGDDGQWHRQQN